MDQKQNVTEQIIEKLEREGFVGEELRRQIQAGIASGMPVFNATFSRDYGEEHMDYRLMFTQTPNVQLPYIFTELYARHRDPVDIEPLEINGINTADLDASMASVDWSAFFNGRLSDETAAEQMVASLRQLSTDDPPYGRYTQQCLMYKHWPEDIYLKYRDPEQPNLKKVHEHSYTFQSSKGEILNAHLAYNIISERYDSLRDVIETLGLPEIDTPYPVYNMLIAELRKDQEAFLLQGHFNLQEGYAEFSIPVAKIDGWYRIQDYELNFTPYPALDHDTYNGIDSAELEADMRTVNWKNDNELFIFIEDTMPDFKSAVNSIQERLYRLSQDLLGMEVANILRLKYHTDVTFFGDNIDQSAWDRLDELPKLSRKFQANQPMLAAALLLAGRATFSPTVPEQTENVRQWTRLDLTNANQGFPARTVEGFSRQELEELLRTVSSITTDRSRVVQELMDGKLARLNTSTDKLVLIEAIPEKRDLRFFTPALRPIPVNLRLDPDWLPEPGEQHKKDLIQNQSNKFKHPKKHPRKGL